MCDPIKTKGNNQRRCYMDFEWREHATPVLNTATRVEILWREKKISTVRTAKIWKYHRGMLLKERMYILSQKGSQINVIHEGKNLDKEKEKGNKIFLKR